VDSGKYPDLDPRLVNFSGAERKNGVRTANLRPNARSRASRRAELPIGRLGLPAAQANHGRSEPLRNAGGRALGAGGDEIAPAASVITLVDIGSVSLLN